MAGSSALLAVRRIGSKKEGVGSLFIQKSNLNNHQSEIQPNDETAPHKIGLTIDE
jgi:hypothetical protein